MPIEPTTTGTITPDQIRTRIFRETGTAFSTETISAWLTSEDAPRLTAWVQDRGPMPDCVREIIEADSAEDQPPMVVGIDPSFTSTGVCWGRGDADQGIACYGRGTLGDDPHSRMKRIDRLVGAIMEKLAEVKPDAVFLENYSFGSGKLGGSRLVYAGELGGILRWHLTEDYPRLFEVAPNTLKKFVTGKGSGGKHLVAQHVTQRWGKVFQTPDETDSYGLWRLGLAAVGTDEASTVAQRAAVQAVIGGRRLAIPKTVPF